MGIGSVKGKNSDTHHTASRHSVLSGSSNTGPSHVGVPAGLKAIMSIPRHVKVPRGETLKLSGKHSTGHIKSFIWSFTLLDRSNNDTIDPTLQPVPPLRKLSKEGAEISIVALRSLKVTLTVTDTENSSHPAEATIEVTPRPWRTEFVSHPGVKKMRGIFSREQGDSYAFGMNNCTFEGVPVDGKGAGHALHCVRDYVPAKQDDPDSSAVYGYEDEERGFAVDVVSDPGGPFHGLWYVASYNVKVNRTLFVNETLMPGGNIYEINHAVHKYSQSMDKVLEGVKRHEQIHSDLMKEQLPKVDPAPKLEAYVTENGDDLRSMANSACVDANSALVEDDYHEEKVHERLRKRGFDHPGTIMLGDGSELQIQSIANIGDVGLG